MQFKYNFTESRKDKVPFLNIAVKNRDSSKVINYIAMLDSGAYISIFHSDIAKLLGIDLSIITDKQVFGGVEKSDRELSGKPYIVKLLLTQKGKDYEFETPVIFSDQITDQGFALLGRQGFFDQFDKICFDYKNSKFYLSF